MREKIDTLLYTLLIAETDLKILVEDILLCY